MKGERSEGLESFVAIVEHGSIAAAARALDIPRETLSRRLSRLEERLGLRLVHRSTRSLSTTREGDALYVHARRMVDAAEEAIRAVQSADDVPRGVLRLSIPANSAGGFVGAMLKDFLDAWPEVELEALSTDRYVDLRSEKIDVALRGGDPQDDGLIARRLWHMDMCAVASAAYVERHGLPQSLEALAEHTCVLGLSGERPARSWPTLEGGAVEVVGRMATNDRAMRMTMIRCGAGIGLVLTANVADELSSGALVPVLPELLGARAHMSVVFAEKEMMLPRVRAFVDHAVRWFADHDLAFALRTSFGVL